MLFEGILRRVRQHHAIEHATVTVLFERHGRFRMVGWSDPGGFHIFGDVDADAVHEAAREALARLQSGRRELAITDLCGGNILVTAALVAAATLVATGRRGWREFPAAVSLGTLAVVTAPLVGRTLQRRVTTEAEVAGLAIASIRELPNPGKMRHYRIRVSAAPGT